MNHRDAVVELLSCRTEFEAEAIAAALRAREITAQAMGGMLTGFRAEAPAIARVMVLAGQLEQARAALAELRAQSAQNEAEPSPIEAEGGSASAVGPDPVLSSADQPTADQDGDGGAQAAGRRLPAVTAGVLAVLLVVASSLGVPPAVQMAVGIALLVAVALLVKDVLAARSDAPPSGPVDPFGGSSGDPSPGPYRFPSERRDR